MAKDLNKTDIHNLIAAIRSLETTVKSLATGNNPVKHVQPIPVVPSVTNRRQSGIGTEVTSEVIKRQAYIRVVFLKIGEIDTINEKYAADVFIHGRWREPLLDNHTDMTADQVDWTQYWSPKLGISNFLKTDKEEKWSTLTFDNQGQAMVHSKQRLAGTFLEYMELRQFPFDTQDLTITVASDLGEHEIELLEDDLEICGVNRDSFVDMQEWHLHSSIFTWAKTTTKVFQSAKHKHPAFSVACKASRRPGFFIWNVIILMLFICSLSFTIFAVNVQLIPNRLQLSFILLLTTVTFKFVVTHNLPKISYTTYLDKYILCSMIFLCVVTIWHVVAFQLDKRGHSTAEFADQVAFYVLVSLWVFFQAFFFIFVASISYYNKNIVAKVRGAYKSVTNGMKRSPASPVNNRKPSYFKPPAATSSSENKVMPQVIVTSEFEHTEKLSTIERDSASKKKITIGND